MNLKILLEDKVVGKITIDEEVIGQLLLRAFMHMDFARKVSKK